MSKLIVSNIMSLDGYVEGPGGNMMVLPMDGFFDSYNLERLRTAGTLLLGATTYTGLKGYWPQVAQDPTVSPAVAADPTVAEIHRETGTRNNQIAKIVISDSLTDDDTAPWTDTTTIVARAEAHSAVTALKEQAVDDILVFGSSILWNDLLTGGLVDELHLMVGSAAVGGGKPAFTGPVPSMKLLESRSEKNSENILLRYGLS
ncbi:MAG: deaminase [Acidimicrobiia bacterium]|nr:deaminase [Acidimicrobiia bacterium]